MQKLEIRAGLKNDLTNEVMGTFAGPGSTGGSHVVPFKKPVIADYITFQLKMNKVFLHVNGIRLNDKPAIDTKGKFPL